MKRMKELLRLQVGRLWKTAVFPLALVFSLCLSVDSFSIVSHAESAGRVTSSIGANVRSSASASGTLLTSLAQNETVSIRSQVQASDGYTWYEVWVDADKLGYVRSDLVEITDGSTPPSSSEVTPSTPESGDGGTGTSGVPAGVTALNPVSAIVANGGTNGVRIRSNPSTNSQIITSVQNGLALTVTGQADSQDNDGKTWWYVSFISNNAQVNGFIRSDYAELTEDPTPYTEPEAEPTEPADDTDDVGDVYEPLETKEYDTMFVDGDWRLVLNNTNPPSFYNISEMLQMVSDNQEVYNGMQQTINTQKIALVILVLLLVVVIGAVGFLAYKVKDMTDSAYFSEVENETMRRRNTQGGQRVMHNVGSEKRGAGQGQRPAGTKPTGSPQGGQRPMGAPQGQKPAGAPQGQRPAGTPQGQKPAGTSQDQRPAGVPQGQRPVGAPQGQRPSGAPRNQKPSDAQGQRPVGSVRKVGMSQPKNFMADDDEFEFEFLNHDGNDKDI